MAAPVIFAVLYFGSRRFLLGCPQVTAVHCTKHCTTGRSDELADAGTSVAELDSECSRGPPQAEFDAHGLRDVSRGMVTPPSLCTGRQKLSPGQHWFHLRPAQPRRVCGLVPIDQSGVGEDAGGGVGGSLTRRVSRGCSGAVLPARGENHEATGVPGGLDGRGRARGLGYTC